MAKVGAKRILNLVIWGVVSLHVAVILLLQTSAIQSWIGSKVAAVASETLGTRVSVGRIGVGLFNRITIDDVCIPDLEGDTLLQVSRLSVKASLLPLLEGRINITTAQVFGAHARLSQADTASVPNYQFIIDALSSGNDSTADNALNLRIGSLRVHRSSVSYDRGGSSPSHLHFADINTNITLRSLTADSIDVNLRRLSMHEQSGLTIKDLTARLSAGRSGARLRSLRLQLPSTVIALDTLDATYDLTQANDSALSAPYSRLRSTLRYRAVSGRTTVTPADIVPLAALFPSIFSGGMCQPSAFASLPAISLSCSIEGTATTLSLPNLHVFTADGGLDLKVFGEAAVGSNIPCGHLQIDRLNVSSPTLAAFREAFPVIPSVLMRLGDIHLSGMALNKSDGNSSCEAYVATTLGGADILIAKDNHDRLSGHIATDSLHLGCLLDNADLGHAAATIAIGGTWEQPEATATVHSLQFRGHTFRGIEASGSYNTRSGLLTANAAAHIEHMHPSVVGLSDEWGVEAIDASVYTDIAATGTDDIRGNLRLNDFSLSTATDSVLFSMNRLLVSKDSTLRIISDNCYGELSGKFGWQSLRDIPIRYLVSRLPSLPGMQQDIAELAHAGTTATKTDHFRLNFNIGDTRWLNHLFGIPLRLIQPLHFTAEANDSANTIGLDCRLPSFTYGDSRYRDMGISITTHGDSAICNTRLTRIDDDGGQLAIGLGLVAVNDNINTSLTWNDMPPVDTHSDKNMQGRATRGTLNTVTQLYTNADGQPEVHVGVQPSQIMAGATPWHIRPGSITYNKGHLTVDSLAVAAYRQHLIVNGKASASPADTLTADMEGLDIAYIQDLLNFHPVDFSGQLGGRAQATALFGDFSAQADIVARDFRFMDGRMGTLMAKALWNADDKQIDIDATADDGPSSKTVIKGYISPVRSDIDLVMRAEGTSIEFCHSFTKSVFSDISGKAHGTVELAGPLGNMNLTGLLTVDGRMSVGALNTTYTMEHDTIAFVPNDIQLRNAIATDRNGNTAILSGGIHHRWLKGFTFDINVDAHNTLVYDFPSFGDSNICGTVRANGHAELHGRPGEVVIDCNVTPQAGSTFAYNAANPDAVSRQEFITWGGSPSPGPSPGEGSIYLNHGETADNTPRYSHSEETADNTTRYSHSGETAGEVTTPLPRGGASGGGASSDLIINFLINANPDVTLRLLMDAATGDYITLNGEGIIRATFHNKGPFQMFGTYTVSRGTYGITIQNIIKKNFTFQRDGTIVFGGDPFNAALNLQAIHTVNGVSLSDLNMGSSFSNNTVRVNCLMNITGTPSQPQADFDLKLPTVNSEEQQMIHSLIASKQEMNQQVLYLLGIGRFYTQGANNADAQQYGQTTLAMQSFLSGTVSTQINEVLSQVIKSNDWNFGANISTGNEGWNNAEYEGMFSGRLLDNRLLINGQFGYRDKATSTTSSFIGDFDIQYLLRRNGSLAVKVYNQTNDRYFTRSSLNTQGVGLILKKDFDGLGDLLRRRRK